jgi:hypothetical protein
MYMLGFEAWKLTSAGMQADLRSTRHGTDLLMEKEHVEDLGITAI